MKRIILTAIAALWGLSCLAGEPFSRHQVSIGWGDMLFETMAFHESPSHGYAPELLPADFITSERHKMGYTGHLFASYLYRLNKVVSLGGQLDFEGIFWTEANYDRYHNQQGEATRCRNYNLSMLPTARFTFLDKEWVRLHAGVGTGLLLAFDNAGVLEAAPVLDLNLISVEVGKGQWSGTVGFGLMAALANANKVYMLGSRLVSVSLNYHW